MKCFKCSTENSEGRRFCRECGSPIVNFCQRCGFHNSLIDKYCGGCGADLVDINTPVSRENISSKLPAGVINNKYSAADIGELIDVLSQEDDKKVKKKDIKEDDEVSQDLLDSMFDSKDSEIDKKEK